MKILLVVPNIKSFDIMPSLSVASLKGFINEKTKHEAKIADLVFHKKIWKKYLKEKIRKEKPDLIGLSVLSFNYPEALHIAKFIKKNFGIKIIFGGVHVILSPHEVIENEDVDIICTGEGEETLKELLDHNLNCKNIEGIWYKQDSKIYKNKNRKLIENLDKIAFPNFEDFELDKYFVINHNHVPIMTSRGCPYKCTYCSNHALSKKLDGKYVRFRNVDSVMEEIGLRIKQYYEKGFRYLHLFDDTFILYKNFVYEFCEKFMKKGFDKRLKWTANVRANLVTDRLVKIMKDAGCYEMRMGVESGNDYILNTVYKRNMSKEQLNNAFRTIQKQGVQLRMDFIIGAPYETINMMRESFELAKQSNGDRISFAKLYPFPGTEIKDFCEKEHVIEKNLHFKEKGMPPVDRTKFTTKRQMKNFTRNILWWQGQRYFNQGFKMRGISFLWDTLAFLLYSKHKYNLDFGQILQWNIQRYKFAIMHM